MKENEENIQIEKQKRILREQEDIKKGEEEREKMEKFTREEDSKKKEVVKKEFTDFTKLQKELVEKMKLEEKEEDLIIKIYGEAKHKIACLRRKKEQEVFF